VVRLPVPVRRLGLAYDEAGLVLDQPGIAVRMA
jgi:hypothetical protein